MPSSLPATTRRSSPATPRSRTRQSGRWCWGAASWWSATTGSNWRGATDSRGPAAPPGGNSCRAAEVVRSRRVAAETWTCCSGWNLGNKTWRERGRAGVVVRVKECRGFMKCTRRLLKVAAWDEGIVNRRSIRCMLDNIYNTARKVSSYAVEDKLDSILCHCGCAEDMFLCHSTASSSHAQSTLSYNSCIPITHNTQTISILMSDPYSSVSNNIIDKLNTPPELN